MSETACSDLLAAALRYAGAGFCVIPAVAERKTTPEGMPWKDYQSRRPDETELRRFLENPPVDALAFVCGSISGNLVTIDFDLGAEKIFARWIAIVQADIPGLRERLVIARTPSGGRHVYVRSATPVGKGAKLARRLFPCETSEEIVVGNKSFKPRQRSDGAWAVEAVLIETRGEGQLALCPPGPGRAFVQGDVESIPTLDSREFDALIGAAIALNEYVPPASTPPNSTGVSSGEDRPGDEFNRRGDVRAVLERHGWRCVRDGENSYWRRPGKNGGHSATLNDACFYVFSSNGAPFEPDRGYSKFAVYALLEHDGDFGVAANELKRLGFGSTHRASSAANSATVTPQTRSWTPFPTEVQPPVVRRYVEQAAASMVIDSSMIVLPLLASLAAIIGTTRRLRLTSGADPWYAYAIIWAAIIAASGSKKSPALATALAPLRRQNADLERRSAEEMRGYKKLMLRYHKDLTKWKHDKSEKDPPEEPKRPPWRQHITSDTTLEAVALILHDNPRGVIVARDELAAWIGAHDAYHGGGHRDTPAWLELHRAGDFAVDRVSHRLAGREPIRVKGAGVSITGTIQPEVIERIAGDHLEDGMLARFALAMPPGQKKVWTDRVVAQEVVTEMDGVCARLGALRHEEIEHRGLDKQITIEYRPIDLTLSPEALQIWKSWYKEHASRQAEAEGPVGYALAKIEELAARIALIMALVVDSDAGVVGQEAMQAGVTMARWFADEAERIYGIWEETDDQRRVRKAAEWVAGREGQYATARDLSHHGPRCYRGKADAAERDLEAAVKAGLLGRDGPISGPKGGRPTVVYRVLEPGPGTETPDSPEKNEVSVPAPPEKVQESHEEEATVWRG